MGWYVLAIVLVLVTAVLPSLLAQTIQGRANIATELAGKEVSATVNELGLSVSVVGWAAILTVIAVFSRPAII